MPYQQCTLIYFAMTSPFSISKREIDPEVPLQRKDVRVSTVRPIIIDCRKLSAVPCETIRIFSRSFDVISS